MMTRWTSITEGQPLPPGWEASGVDGLIYYVGPPTPADLAHATLEPLGEN